MYGRATAVALMSEPIPFPIPNFGFAIPKNPQCARVPSQQSHGARDSRWAWASAQYVHSTALSVHTAVDRSHDRIAYIYNSHRTLRRPAQLMSSWCAHAHERRPPQPPHVSAVTHPVLLRCLCHWELLDAYSGGPNGPQLMSWQRVRSSSWCVVAPLSICMLSNPSAFPAAAQNPSFSHGKPGHPGNAEQFGLWVWPSSSAGTQRTPSLPPWDGCDRSQARTEWFRSKNGTMANLREIMVSPTLTKIPEPRAG